MEKHVSEPCPICSSNESAEIVFGFPGDITLIQSELDQGTKVLGGCDIPENPPKYVCKICEHEWGESEWKQIIEDEEKAKIAYEEKKESEALARGVFEAQPNEHGYVKCPHCGMKFSVRHDMSWDGTKHKSCRTRIKLVSAEQGVPPKSDRAGG